MENSKGNTELVTVPAGASYPTSCGSLRCRSEEVLSKLKERLKNEVENNTQTGWLVPKDYLEAIEDVLEIINKLEKP